MVLVNTERFLITLQPFVIVVVTVCFIAFCFYDYGNALIRVSYTVMLIVKCRASDTECVIVMLQCLVKLTLIGQNVSDVTERLRNFRIFIT